VYEAFKVRVLLHYCHQHFEPKLNQLAKRLRSKSKSEDKDSAAIKVFRMDGYENKVPDAWKPWISFESFPTLYLLVKMPGRYGPYYNTVYICLKPLLRLCIYMLYGCIKALCINSLRLFQASVRLC
jgi:hypothetical protein